jgi:putative flippase GtrA
MLINKILDPSKKQAAKFLLAGLINSFFGYALYAALIFCGIYALLALLVSTIGGVLFNYFSFSRMVFSGIGGPMVLLRFLISYFVVYSVNSILLIVILSIDNLNPYISQIICMPITISLTWFLMRGWVYRK